MRFDVKGADKITGQEVVIPVDASRETEAIAVGNERGILVESASRPVAPVISYRNPALAILSPTNDAESVARVLRLCATVIASIGVLVAGGGVLSLLNMVLSSIISRPSMSSLFGDGMSALTSIATGVIFVAGAASLRMLAIIGTRA